MFRNAKASIFLAFAFASQGAVFAQAPSSNLTGTLAKVRETGSITIGTRTASIPFNYLDDNNKQAGFAWEIEQRVVERVKKDLNLPSLQVKTLEVTPQTRIPLVANQTLDLECSSTTNNLERQKQVSFSNSYFMVGVRLQVRADSGIKEWSDIAGKTVAVEAGTTTERAVRQKNEQNKWDATVVLTKDINEAFLALETGRVKAVAQDDIISYALASAARDPKRWAIVGSPLTREAYGCVLRKDDPQFKALVDDVIVQMAKSGELEKLFDKYFQQKINVKGGMTVGFPLNDDLRELYRHPNDKAL